MECRNMSEWEYRIVNLANLPPNTTELDLLEEAGKEGWELVAVTSNNIAYLKRALTKRRSPPSRPLSAAPKRQD